MKVSLFNRKLLKLYGATVGILSSIASLVQIFYDLPDNCKVRIWGFIVFILLLIIVYLSMWVMANRCKSATLKINNTRINIIEGDIFKQPDLKVIPFNEYFDTVVDDVVISSNTLHGQYILNYIDDVNELNRKISNDKRLRKLHTIVDNKREYGKKVKYPLGTIYKNGEYLLLAFSMFDEENRAYLNKRDIIKCLLNMWNEIDILYSGYSINLPLLGTGITRFHGLNLSEQELLEILIISFKLSGLTLKKGTNINIVIYGDSVNKINFFNLA